MRRREGGRDGRAVSNCEAGKRQPLRCGEGGWEVRCRQRCLDAQADRTIERHEQGLIGGQWE